MYVKKINLIGEFMHKNYDILSVVYVEVQLLKIYQTRMVKVEII